MFEGPDYQKSLDEDLFDQWLENGRSSRINNEFMVVVWDDQERDYHPEYFQSRTDIEQNGLGYFGQTNDLRSIVAVYNLFSESKISFNN